MEQFEATFKHDQTGQPIKADVFYSIHYESKGARPIVIAFHGGGFVIGSKEMIPKPQVTELVEMGFVVVAPNYRLCPAISLHDGPLADSKDCYTWATTGLSTLLQGKTQVDPSKIALVGYSAGATLALLLGTMPQPPRAIVAFYGALNFQDPFWSSPLPALANLPSFDISFTQKVYDEGVPSHTPSSMVRPPPGGGMPAPDLSKPRNAWLFSAIKNGTHMKDVVKDQNYDRIDPFNFLSPGYPPTLFIHGNADTLVDCRFSVNAFNKLKGSGVETELVLVEGKSHGFDIFLEQGMKGWDEVCKGFQFLGKYLP